MTITHTQLRTRQDEERKRLLSARDRIRNDMGIMVSKSHGPAQVDPNQCTDLTEKTGYLGKRPDNALRLPRRQWPKKYCSVNMQGFTLANSHVSGCLCLCHVLTMFVRTSVTTLRLEPILSSHHHHHHTITLHYFTLPPKSPYHCTCTPTSTLHQYSVCIITKPLPIHV